MRGWLMALAVFPFAVLADWQFTDAIPVSKQHGDRVFHHLDSSGRRNIAVSSGEVAITWEHNGDGTPRVYLATRKVEGGQFGDAMQISGGQAAYEPSLVALPEHRFVLAWEELGAVWVRLVTGGKASEPVKLAANASQVSLARSGDNDVAAVWSETRGAQGVVRFARIVVDSQGLQPLTPVSVDSEPPAVPQNYPAVVASASGFTVVWQDRRRGTGTIYYSVSADGGRFSKAEPLSEHIVKSRAYGRGSGVTRAVIARYGKDKVGAAWLDKRSFQSGYEVYASVSDDGGHEFDRNLRVQDEFGDEIPQWHPAISGNDDGKLIVVWDDSRDDNPDLWMAVYKWGHWGSDNLVEPASGDGRQTSPTITFDEEGRLHLAWLEQMQKGGPRTLRYAVGTKK